MKTRVLIGLALTAAAIRLIPLQWLHPLNWDEIEFFRAMRWIAEGRVPFRDFWEHHTPLAWFVFAPVAALVDGPGVEAVLALRWAQVPVWIVTFWLANLWMKHADLGAFARWSAIALALSSSLFMLAAVEFRVDSLACMLYMAGLVLAQRDRPFAAGVAFCLAGFANIRFGPLLLLTVLVLRIVDTKARAWRGNPRMNRVFLCTATAFAACLLYFVVTGSLDELYQQVWYENYLGDKYSVAPGPMFLHRLVLPFGIRLLATDKIFNFELIDPGGIAILVLGFAGIYFAARWWRTPDELTVLAFLQASSILFIGVMKFVFLYHFEIVVIMALPLMALVIERMGRPSMRRPRLVIALVAVAWCVNVYASLFRGKELDLAYQDLLMREIDRRSTPAEKVFSGGPWPITRQPAYRFWFLPELARHLVMYGHAQRYRLEDVLRDPPAVVVSDHYTAHWLGRIQREIAPYFVRHYMPVWRNLWVPAMNVVARPGAAPFTWVVPRDGAYRVFASHALAQHDWFGNPLAVGTYERRDGKSVAVTLPAPAPHPSLEWTIDGKPASVGAVIPLKKGQRIAVANRGSEILGVILLPGDDRVLFRNPPHGTTLEAAATRVTHVPDFGARIEP